MSDKPAIQNELSSSLSSMISSLNENVRLEYVRNFWKIMSLEWNGLDRLRLNKFYFLMKKMCHDHLSFLHQSEWKNIVENMDSLLWDDESVPDGVKTYQIECFFEILPAVWNSGKKVLDSLFKPILSLLKRSKKNGIFQKIEEGFLSLFKEELIGIDSLKYLIFQAASDKAITDKNRSRIFEIYKKCPGKEVEIYLTNGGLEKETKKGVAKSKLQPMDEAIMDPNNTMTIAQTNENSQSLVCTNNDRFCYQIILVGASTI